MIYIVCSILLLMALLNAFFFGYMFALKKNKTAVKRLTEAQKKALEKEQKEYQNFLKYDGTSQL